MKSVYKGLLICKDYFDCLMKLFLEFFLGCMLFRCNEGRILIFVDDVEVDIIRF